jgi:hypothetical protein
VAAHHTSPAHHDGGRTRTSRGSSTSVLRTTGLRQLGRMLPVVLLGAEGRTGDHTDVDVGAGHEVVSHQRGGRRHEKHRQGRGRETLQGKYRGGRGESGASGARANRDERDRRERDEGDDADSRWRPSWDPKRASDLPAKPSWAARPRERDEDMERWGDQRDRRRDWYERDVDDRDVAGPSRPYR